MMVTSQDGRKAVSVKQAALFLGVGRSLAWQLVREGKLRSVRASTRVLVPLTAIDEFLAGESPKDDSQA